MMTSAKEWLYFLLTKDGRSKKQDKVSYEVSETTEPTPLNYTPDAWMDIKFGFVRDQKRIGMTNTANFPLRFVMDGATIVRDSIYRLGCDIELFLFISRRTVEFTDTDYADYHKKWLRAPLDLTSMVDEEHLITIKVGEYGLAKALKANENTKYAFKLSDPEAINIRMDGLLLEDTVNFLVSPIELSLANGIVEHYLPAGMTTRDGQAAGFAGFTVFADKLEPPATSIKYLFETDQVITGLHCTGNVSMSIKLGGTPTNNGSTTDNRVLVVLYSNLRPNILSSPIQFLSDGGSGGHKLTTVMNFVSLDFDFTFNAQKGEKFFIAVVPAGQKSIVKFEYLESRFTIDFRSRYKPTVIRAFQPHILLDKLIEKIAGKRNMSVSTLLSSLKYRDLVLTSGDGLRGLDEAEVKLSFNDFFNTYQIYTFGGCAITREQLEFEIIDRYLDYSNPIELGEVAELKTTWANDMMGNTLQIGHKQKDPDEVNGKFSFNNTFTWKTKKPAPATPLKYVSEAIADPYTIESLRINFDGKKTTDAEGDNEIYVLATEPDTDNSFSSRVDLLMVFGVLPVMQVYDLSKMSLFTEGLKIPIRGSQFNDGIVTVASVQMDAGGTTFLVYLTKAVVPETNITITLGLKYNKLLRRNYDSITGVPVDAALFNIELLSPKRLLLLWKRWFNSVFYRLDGTELFDPITERNADLKTVLNGVVIEEKAPLVITKDFMWKPFWFEIRVNTPYNLIELNQENPNRCFSFIWEDRLYKGFNWTSGCSPDDNEPQVFKLLCAPDSFEPNLIR